MSGWRGCRCALALCVLIFAPLARADIDVPFAGCFDAAARLPLDDDGGPSNG